MPTRPALPHAVSLPRPPALLRYPHRSRRRWMPLLKLGGDAVLILLVLAALMAILVDVVDHSVHSRRTSRIADVATALGLYIAVCSHSLIDREYDRVSLIAKVSQPKGRTFAGWGGPGGHCDGARFRSAILDTIPTLRIALQPHSPLLPLGPLARSCPLSPLAPLLALRPSPVPAALRPLAELYEQKLLEAKYGKAEPTEEDWEAVVKVVAVVVGVLQGKQEGKGVDLGGGG
ncbi:hypothetical protein JCM11251_004969 [Rhodosporidiobolus azoricus]